MPRNIVSCWGVSQLRVRYEVGRVLRWLGPGISVSSTKVKVIKSFIPLVKIFIWFYETKMYFILIWKIWDSVNIYCFLGEHLMPLEQWLGTSSLGSEGCHKTKKIVRKTAHCFYINHENILLIQREPSLIIPHVISYCALYLSARSLEQSWTD